MHYGSIVVKEIMHMLNKRQVIILLMKVIDITTGFFFSFFLFFLFCNLYSGLFWLFPGADECTFLLGKHLGTWKLKLFKS